MHRLEPLIGLEVEHDGALVPSEDLPHEGLVIRRIAPPHAAGPVAGRRFHLDDVGAEVAEVLRRAGTRQHGRHVHDPEPLQRLHRAGGYGLWRVAQATRRRDDVARTASTMSTAPATTVTNIQ